MTRSDPDPNTNRAASELADLFREVRADALRNGPGEGLRLLAETLKGRSAPDPYAHDTSIDEWRRATRDAARKLCTDAGRHAYGVMGALQPTEVRCSRCGGTWPVGGAR